MFKQIEILYFRIKLLMSNQQRIFDDIRVSILIDMQGYYTWCYHQSLVQKLRLCPMGRDLMPLIWICCWYIRSSKNSAEKNFSKKPKEHFQCDFVFEPAGLFSEYFLSVVCIHSWILWKVWSDFFHLLVNREKILKKVLEMQEPIGAAKRQNGKP